VRDVGSSRVDILSIFAMVDYAKDLGIGEKNARVFGFVLPFKFVFLFLFSPI
jgi:hypothetical protein